MPFGNQAARRASQGEPGSVGPECDRAPEDQDPVPEEEKRPQGPQAPLRGLRADLRRVPSPSRKGSAAAAAKLMEAAYASPSPSKGRGRSLSGADTPRARRHEASRPPPLTELNLEEDELRYHNGSTCGICIVL
mmetsp:Transcript_87831/g.190217  ORF Transcript_87831/g.190217 Transcript_87831/m.190217 type:complete len:134 (+) Transcript_87831:120-521(+)